MGLDVFERFELVEVAMRRKFGDEKAMWCEVWNDAREKHGTELFSSST